jgi:farnesyl diphosphate synthase
LDAVNDAILLESFLYFLLKEYLQDNLLAYIKFADLFREISLCTQVGQMLDLTSQPQGREAKGDFNDFTEKLYGQIVKYKTSLYTFYLSIASAMLLTGYTDENTFNTARRISVALGTKFQIEDDYLDAFGVDIGKVGTDIKDHKASWLCVQALKLMTAEQRAVFEANYGKESAECEAVIKQIYRDLELPRIYDELEDSSKAEIEALVEEVKDQLPPQLFIKQLNKIHKRTK